jgi:signal transduction histidine kinase
MGCACASATTAPARLRADPGARGHGLTGMRERATAVGGQLRTGATTVGGFLVEATLPAARETNL